MPWPNWKVTPVKLGKATREAYGLALKELGREVPELVVFDRGLSASTMTVASPRNFPIASLIWVSKRPIWWERRRGWPPAANSLRIQFLFLSTLQSIRSNPHGRRILRVPVKLVGSHGGISLGQDGVCKWRRKLRGAHVDVSGLCGGCPRGRSGCHAATRALVEWDGPAYMRVGRPEGAHRIRRRLPLHVGQSH